MNSVTSKLFESATFVKSKSSANAGGQCIEVARADGFIGIRDSKNPSGAILVFTPGEWNAFVTGVRNGEFD